MAGAAGGATAALRSEFWPDEALVDFLAESEGWPDDYVLDDYALRAVIAKGEREDGDGTA